MNALSGWTKVSGFAETCVRAAGAVALVVASASSPVLAGAQAASPEVTGLTPKAISHDRQLWQKAIVKLPVPSKGCHEATYPAVEWTTVPCRTGPAKNLPIPGTKLGPTPRTPPKASDKLVGGSADDFGAEVPSSNTGALIGTIASAQGSFDKVTVTGETNVSANGIPTRKSEYSLQLNSNLFPSPLCKGAPNTACQGWQQFIFANDPGSPPSYTQTQYYLLNYNVNSNGSCPTGWTPWGIHCYIYSPTSNIPTQNIESLINISLTVRAEANGTDTMIFTDPDGSVYASNADSILTLAPNWTAAEFNVFGDLSQHQAVFDPGSSLVVRTQVDLANTTPTPVPVLLRLTGESNSLTLVRPACTIGSPFFAITFEESNVPGASYTCPTSPPPQNLCQDAKELVAFDQKALATAQSAFHTPSCQGPAMFLCEQRIKAAQQALQSAEAQEKKDCPVP
jgi:hypothetical protein